MNEELKDRGLKKAVREQTTFRLPSNFTYRTMQKVEEAIRLREKKSERRILLATIAAAIFLIGVSGTGLVLYFGDSIREAFTPTTLPISFLVLFSYFSIFKPLLVVCIAYKNNIVIKHAVKPDGWHLL